MKHHISWRKTLRVSGLLILLAALGFGGTNAFQVSASGSINVWWPTDGAHVSDTQPFKAMVSDKNISDYSMTWSVDGGQSNSMYDSNQDYPHKEAMVDLANWTWRGSGPYKVTFKANDKSGNSLGETSVNIYTPGGAPQSSSNTASSQNTAPVIVTTPAATSPAPTTISTVQPVATTQPVQITQPVEIVRSTQPEPATQPAPTTVVSPAVTQVVQSGNPLSGVKFFINPNSNAKRQADLWRSSRPQDAYQMDKIASNPEVTWLGGWSGDVGAAVTEKINQAKSQGAMPIFVAYNIPNRDCGQYSSGGVSDASAYSSWIQQIANAIGSNKAVVILEPDGVTHTGCFSASQETERFNMLSNAVSTLKSKSNIAVYIDAGHSAWLPIDDVSARLVKAGIAKANGFALNTSNFRTTDENIRYGEAVSSKVGGKHFVIDTARNGLGPNGTEWCNPMGRALGAKATASTGNSLVDAFLWLKNPGESDGNCNGGPSAGVWWPEYALGLAQRSAY